MAQKLANVVYSFISKDDSRERYPDRPPSANYVVQESTIKTNTTTLNMDLALQLPLAKFDSAIHSENVVMLICGMRTLRKKTVDR